MPRAEGQIDDNVHRSKMRWEITVRVREVSRRRTLIEDISNLLRTSVARIDYLGAGINGASRECHLGRSR